MFSAGKMQIYQSLTGWYFTGKIAGKSVDDGIGTSPPFRVAVCQKSPGQCEGKVELESTGMGGKSDCYIPESISCSRMGPDNRRHAHSDF